MTAEVTGGRKLTQPMPDHVLGDIDGHMSAAIVNSNGVANHLREDRARATPGSEDLLLAFGVHCFNFFQPLRG